MKAQWQREKDAIGAVTVVRERLEQARVEAEKAERDADLQRAAELRYGEIPALEKQLAEAEATRAARRTGGAQFLKERVDAEDIAEVVGKWTGIPVSRLMEGEVEKLVHMEERLHQRVIGQHEAVEAVANALRRSRAGLQDPDRPIGTFLFLGPTGVGKTELARALAEFMFDSQDAMIRIDMSEYMERHAVSRLVGAPPGYVGYEEGGQLTEAVRRRPYSVVLLDEVEKAHGDVFNILLQVMDDGRLTDGQGRTVDFKNVVLIMTSNIPGGKTGAEEHFRPEFINRLDDIVEFEPLSREQIGTIVDLQVARLIKTRAGARDRDPADRRRAHAARQPRLRPDVRCAAAQAGDPEAAGRQARARDPGGRVRRRRSRRGRRGRGRAGLHEGGAGGGGLVPRLPAARSSSGSRRSSDLEADQQAGGGRRSVGVVRVDLEGPRPVARI